MRTRDKVRLINPIPFAMVIGLFMVYHIVTPLRETNLGLLISLLPLAVGLVFMRALMVYNFLLFDTLEEFGRSSESIEDPEARFEAFLFSFHEAAHNSFRYFDIELRLCLAMMEMYYPELKPLPQDEQDWGSTDE